MKSIIFDAGPIISLTTNNLLGLLVNLKQGYKGSFFLSEAVKREVVDTPLEKTLRFKFEALQVLRCIEKGFLEVVDNDRLRQKTLELLDIANQCFKAHGNYIRIVHYAEMSSLALALLLGSEAFVVDERTTRLLIENPRRLVEVLQNKLHTKIETSEENLRKFQSFAKAVKIIRSVELVTIAYEKGILNKYILHIPNAKQTLLESILWGVKLNGCAVSEKEIKQIMKLERKS